MSPAQVDFGGFFEPVDSHVEISQFSIGGLE
jgi:hypothetical protein